MTWRELSDLFVQIELELIASLRRNLTAHKAWEEKEGFRWPAWQEEKIQNLESFRRENQGIIGRYVSVIDQETEAMLRDQYAEGMERVEQETETLRTAGHYFPPASRNITERSFFGVNDRRLQSLIHDIQHTEKKSETAALRLMDDVYRQTVYKADVAMAAGAVTLPKAIDMATEEFLRKGINCIEYKDGKRVNIADYVQMELRTAATRSYLQGEAKKRAELGIDTVLVSQYGACSETCLPWQGRVYIDDIWGDWAGEKNGDLGRNRNGNWYPLLSVAVKNGLFHPNCRHTLSTWYEGISTLPKPMNKETIRRNSRLEQKQRAMEREVRKWKRLEIGSAVPEDKKRYSRKRQAAQKQLKEFVNQHSNVLRRDYWREKVYPSAQALEKSSQKIILNDVNLMPLPINSESLSSIQSFSCDLLSPQLQNRLKNEHKKLLISVSGRPLGTEAGATYDLQMNRLNSVVGEPGAGNIKIPKETVPYIVMHSHPTGETFTHTDLILFAKDQNMKMITAVGNNGFIYAAEKTDSFSLLEFNRLWEDAKAMYPDYLDTPKKYMNCIEYVLKGVERCGIKYHTTRA